MTNWFDDPESEWRGSTDHDSRMRLYIIMGLISFGTLGVIGGMLHVLPA